MDILFMLAIPLVVGILIALIKKPSLRILGSLTRLYLFIQTVYNCYQVYTQGEGFVVRLTDTGLLGIGLKLDLLSASLLVLTAGLFIVYDLYNKGDRSFSPYQDFLLLALEPILFILFMTEDLFNLFALLEVATIISGTLIMLLKEKRSVYDGLVYIIVNSVGVMFYLMGVGIIYKLFGNLDMEVIQAQISEIESKSLVLPFAFIFTGLSVKAALFPVFLWLPKAHGAPGAPAMVSALLSGIYLKTGLYAFVKLALIFHAEINMTHLLFGLGVLTCLIGAVLAVSSNNIKLILAYSTVSQVGLIFTGLSQMQGLAYQGAILHIFNHGLFKSLLFLTIGSIYHIYDTRKIDQIKGLKSKSPFLTVCLIVGLLGLTGAPFMNGSISKYFIMKGGEGVLYTGFLDIMNFASCLYAVKLAGMIWGPSRRPVHIHPYIKVSLSILSVFIVATGLFGVDLFNFLNHATYSLSLQDQLAKWGVWILEIILAGLVVFKVLPKWAPYRRGIHADFEFNTVIFLIVACFMIYLAYGFVVVL